jgi:hypothetical protein
MPMRIPYRLEIGIHEGVVNEGSNNLSQDCIFVNYLLRSKSEKCLVK